MELRIETPKWASPLLRPKRYKGAKGGRGCCHPDTLIDTPSGQVKISEFKGGDVFSYSNGKVVIATATPAVEYTEEQLYLVTLENGQSISVTDEHKFLTSQGWKELKNLNVNDEVVCVPCQVLSCPHQTSSELCQQELHADAPSWKKKHAGYQASCFWCCRQYGQQPLSAKDNDQVFPPLQDDEQQHKSRSLKRMGGLECERKDNLLLPLFHLASWGVPLVMVGQSYVNLGNYICGKISERLSEFCRLSLLFRGKNNPRKQGAKLSVPALCYDILKSLVESLQKVLGKVFSVFVGSPYNPRTTYYKEPILTKITSICKHDRLKYWDLHVYETNNYLSNGIINHNSGKSHFFAEMCVEAMVMFPDTKIVCIREIQKTLKHSAKSLIEGKIEKLGVGHLFDIQTNEIKSKQGSGIIIFQGMQDHTADSIKSLEGFNIAWVEEAQSLSKTSLDLLRPTIRAEGSEIWFSWNPRFETDAVDVFMRTGDANDFVLVHTNSYDNPWLPETLRQERERDKIDRPDDFGHIWLGEYITSTEESFISHKTVAKACERENMPSPEWVRILGCDPSQTADGDSTGLVVRHGNQVVKIAEFNRETVQERADVIRKFIMNNNIDHTFIDQGGSGKEIYDMLIMWGLPRTQITIVPFGAKASSKLYPNKRVEMYSDMRYWLDEEGDIPRIEKLKYELSLTKKKINNNGQEVLESKKDMKKSPNLADALALTFAYPVTKKRKAKATNY